MNATANPHDPQEPWFPCEPFEPSWFDEAPVRFPHDVELDCTPDALFDVFEDPTSWPVWARGIGQVIWTSPQPYGVGTTRTVVFWGGMRVYEVFTAWERGRTMAFQFEGTTQEVWTRFGERYVVDDLGGGRCRLRWTVAYEPTGVFARLHPLLRPIMRWNLGGYMRALHRYVRRLPR